MNIDHRFGQMIGMSLDPNLELGNQRIMCYFDSVTETMINAHFLKSITHKKIL
jgi:hypothetical protein